MLYSVHSLPAHQHPGVCFQKLYVGYRIFLAQYTQMYITDTKPATSRGMVLCYYLINSVNICDKANHMIIGLYVKCIRTQHLPKDYSCQDLKSSVRLSIVFLGTFPPCVPSDSSLISKVTSCDTSTVTHPLLLPLSQPGCPMSEGLVIYRVTSRWRGMQAVGKETLRGRFSRKYSDVPFSHLGTFLECK